MSGEATTQNYPGPPPGWYPDPAGGPGQRWWDGYAWSDAVVQPTQPLPPPPSADLADAPWVGASARLASSVTTAYVHHEISITPMARLAYAVPALASLINLAVLLGNASRFAQLGHELRVIFHDAQHNVTPPPFNDPIGFAWLSSLVGLAALGAIIVALIWQHRAAHAARALDLPATHSPAWGVGSWFVPIVNLWMPYQAIRDCLPAGDPHRPLVLRWWLLLIAAGFLGLGTGIAIYFSEPVALGFAIPQALCDLALITLAPRVVLAVTSAHQAALR